MTTTQGEHAQTEAMYAAAMEFAAEKASISYVQRKCRCSYNDAERMLERMVDEGIIETYGGRKTVATTTAQPAAPRGVAYAPYKQALWSKNCMQCCVSYMLGLPLNSVPDFATDGGWELFSEFVDSKGYAAVMLPDNHEFEADYLASGTTARGTSHMVVMNNGKLVHDPHPSNSGLLEVQCVWLLAKRASPTSGQQDEHAAFEASAKAYTSNVSFARDGDDYEDMTASLLWHGWKLRASNGQAPAGAVPDEQMIAEYGVKASRMMARDLTRFDAACEVDKYLREQGAPGYYRHRMSIILFGNVEGTEASRAPENSEPATTAQAAPAAGAVAGPTRFIVSAVVIKETDTGFNTQNKLYPIESISPQEAEGKVLPLLTQDFPEYRLHTICHIATPAAQADSVLEDAARYRHLRDCNSGSLAVMQITGTGEDDWHILTEDAADAAIDAARKQGGV